jgi:hypothetical protein
VEYWQILVAVLIAIGSFATGVIAVNGASRLLTGWWQGKQYDELKESNVMKDELIATLHSRLDAYEAQDTDVVDLTKKFYQTRADVPDPNR